MSRFLYRLRMIIQFLKFLFVHLFVKVFRKTPRFPEIKESNLGLGEDLRKLFGASKVSFDFGGGNGSFSFHYAKAHPNEVIVSTEIFRRYHKDALNDARGLYTKNMWAMRADGKRTLKYLIKSKSLYQVFINFPDPWHKKKHAKRRLFTPKFFQMVFPKIMSGGALHFISDDKTIFEMAISSARVIASEASSISVGEKAIPQWYPQSKYHKKWLRRGKEVRYFEVRI